MKILNEEWVFEAASKMISSWDPSYLFMATSAGFYFGSAKTISENNGQIDPLGFDNVDAKIQQRYLSLLNTFISKG